MIEREQVQIEIIGEASRKRDYCVIPLAENVQNSLTCLMILESQLSERLSAKQREGIILAHTLLWSGLPDYYKSELADLSAISDR